MSIVLGLGGTIDYEIRWDQSRVERLAQHWNITRNELDSHLPIVDERSLLVSLLAQVSEGTGGERYVDDVATLVSFAEHFGYDVTQGGTCVRAALILSMVGIPSTVHLVSIDDNVRRLMPSDVTTICSAESDTLDPHLIIQYPPGVHVDLAGGPIGSSQANRLIYAHDVANRELVLDPDLVTAAAESDIFLISGFNVMRDRDKLEDRLATAVNAARRVPPGGTIIFEDAGYHHREFQREVNRRIDAVATIHSMNEDELQEYLNRSVDLLDASAVAAALADLQGVIRSPNILVHTKYWALLWGPQARELRAPLQSAIDVAAARFVHGDSLTPRDIAAMAQTPLPPIGREFADRLEDVLPDSVAIPAYELNVPSPTTIGLGDAFIGGLILGLHRQLHQGDK